MALVHRVGWEPNFLSRSPWFWPLTDAASRFQNLTDWPTTRDFDCLYDELTREKGVASLRFGDNVRRQDKRVGGFVNLDALYDARITKHGEVPSRTRDWHDLFNALCFATFPRSKVALHHRQYTILEQRVGHTATQLPGARTREQDALTLFDEGGVVIAVNAMAHQAFAEMGREERQACIARVVEESQQSPHAPRDVFGGKVLVVPFGHALFEHLIEGLRCPGGCTQLLELAEVSCEPVRLLDDVDRALSRALTDPTRFVNPAQCAGMPLSLR